MWNADLERLAVFAHSRLDATVDASTLNSPAELERYGETLARDLPFGTVLILSGPMGAGKTTLTKGIARGLEFSGEVTSPTYTYIHQYPTPHGELVHIDAYRLEDARSLWRMGLEELLETARLTVIEWGEALIPDFERVTVLRLTILESGREISLEASPSE